jgi:hypothetical protein
VRPHRPRIAVLAAALAAATLALGACGGGDSSTDKVRTLGLPICEVSGVRAALTGIEAGIQGLGERSRQRYRRQILRAMRENAAVIRGRLPVLEDCARDAILESEGKPVHEAPARLPDKRPLAIGHRIGPARVEPGEEVLPARPCSLNGKDGIARVPLLPESGGCVRVTPGERLMIENDTGIAGGGGNAIQVTVGDYEVWLGRGQDGLIRAPVGSYLGHGAQKVKAAGAIGNTILVLPKKCAMRAPAAAGEQLCFPERAE